MVWKKKPEGSFQIDSPSSTLEQVKATILENPDSIADELIERYAGDPDVQMEKQYRDIMKTSSKFIEDVKSALAEYKDGDKLEFVQKHMDGTVTTEYTELTDEGGDHSRFYERIIKHIESMQESETVESDTVTTPVGGVIAELAKKGLASVETSMVPQ